MTLDEQLAAIQEGNSSQDRFAAQVLIELLREVCATERRGQTLIEWEWSDRLSDTVAVCGLRPEDEPDLWRWLTDISGDLALEPSDPWAQPEC